MLFVRPAITKENMLRGSFLGHSNAASNTYLLHLLLIGGRNSCTPQLNLLATSNNIFNAAKQTNFVTLIFTLFYTFHRNGPDKSRRFSLSFICKTLIFSALLFLSMQGTGNLFLLVLHCHVRIKISSLQGSNFGHAGEK